MSRFVRQSQLRNLVIDPYPLDQYYSELLVGDVQTQGDLIACSKDFIAFVGQENQNNSIGVIKVKEEGKQHGYNRKTAQQGSVLDLQFSPHDSSVFASGSGKGNAGLWKCNLDEENDPIVVDFDCCAVFGSGDGNKIEAVEWHPSAQGVVALLSKDRTVIYDTCELRGEQIFEYTGSSLTMSACWHPNGSFLACLNRDNTLQLLDPRLNSPTGNGVKAHQNTRGFGRVVSGGGSEHGELENYLYTTGLSLTRDKEVAVWDSRKMDGCLSKTKIAGSGNGIMIPKLIPDTKILFLLTKGETSIRAFEGTKDKPFLYNISQVATSANPLLGFDILPVEACDVMGCEVGRILKLTKNAVEPIRVEIPRRMKSTFNVDIFPNTSDRKHAAMTCKEWMQGENKKQEMVSVLNLFKNKDRREGEGEEDVDDDDDEKEQENLEEEKDETEQVYVPTDVDKTMSNIMGYVPKFKYAHGKQMKKDETIYNIKPANPPALACCDTKFAISWQGGGGPVYVGNLADVGKMDSPESMPVLNGHSRPVISLDFNPFDDNILASGSDDCYIHIWDIENQSSQAALTGHQSAVRLLAFNPTVNRVLASASQDCTVKIWDIHNGGGDQQQPLQTIQAGDDEYFTSMEWNVNGSVLACMGRNQNSLYLVDPRKNSSSCCIEQTHLGAKPCYLTWLPDSNHILTSGCARMGYREFSIWDIRAGDGKKPLSTTKIGTGATSFQPLLVQDNGVVIFISRGENTFHVYEIEGLTKAEIKPDKCGENPLKPHKCNEFIAKGEPTSVAAILPRRICDTGKAEWARVLRLTPTVLEPISFTIPRANDLKEYFADDIYSETKGKTPTIIDPNEWFENTDLSSEPINISMNENKIKRLSSRDPTLAHAAMKKAKANTERFRKQKQEEEQRARERDDAFLRMQALAVQHEAYNPNLSTGGKTEHHQDLGNESDDAVADDEW